MDILTVSAGVGVSVPLLPVAVAEDDHADNVDEEPHPAHDQDHLRVLDLLHEDEPLDGLDRDGEAEGEQEHGVNERAHHLGPRPAEGVGVALLPT